MTDRTLSRALEGGLTAQEVTNGRASIAYRARKAALDAHALGRGLDNAQDGPGGPGAFPLALLASAARRLAQEAADLAAWAEAFSRYPGPAVLDSEADTQEEAARKPSSAHQSQEDRPC